MPLKLILFIPFKNDQSPFIYFTLLLQFVDLICQAIKLFFVDDESMSLKFFDAVWHQFIVVDQQLDQVFELALHFYIVVNVEVLELVGGVNDVETVFYLDFK